MASSWTHISESPLYDEHLLLGALFGEDEPLLATPIHYGDQSGEAETFDAGCALADLTGMTSVLVSGTGASAFVTASCANGQLSVGECGFGAVVTGDGQVSSVPLIARTGDEEYLVWDVSERGLALHPWLAFLAHIEQDGYRPFEGTKVQDVTDALVPLLMWGPKAQAVLGDYVPSLDVLPTAGHVASVRLDRIECLVAAPPMGDEPCYLVLVPPRAARVLWRSFLSFKVVNPVGSASLANRACGPLPWMEGVLGEERLEMTFAQLLAWGLARAEGGFVGARALEA